MKKILALFAICILLCGGVLSVDASEAVTEQELATEAAIELVTEAEPAETFIVPTEDEVREDVTSWVDRLSETFGGMQFWEEAKEWILSNLDMIVGGIMAIATATVGLATRFRWLPRLLNAWETMKNAIGKWYDENSKTLTAFAVSVDALKGQLQELILHEVKPIVEKVEQRSAEVERLELENAELRREYISSRERADRIEGALLEYSKLAAEEFYQLIQQSDLTKEELNRHYDAYHAKLDLIESITSAECTEDGDKA